MNDVPKRIFFTIRKTKFLSSFGCAPLPFRQPFFFFPVSKRKIRPTLFLFYLSSVWALYLADHLWDAKREKEPLSERGAFYLRFRFAIVSSLILSSFVSLFIGISFEFSFLWNHLPYLLSFVLFLF